jgi:hypothetical protein
MLPYTYFSFLIQEDEFKFLDSLFKSSDSLLEIIY